MAKAKYPGPEDKLALYEELVATLPDVKRKGAKNPYTSHNGHMFSFLDETGAVSLRLPKDERGAFLEKYNTKQSFQYNTVMKEYAVVPDAMLEDIAGLAKYIAMSLAYVDSLKPKPTTKKKKV
jgi:hypothetical protein